MKRVISVTLNNKVFMIEEDAYVCLKKALERRFDREKAEQLVCERFESKLNDVKHVITWFDTAETLERLNFQMYCEKTPRKLYRLTNDKVIAGVCSGIGEYLNIDPVIVRIAFVILAPIIFTGFFAYLICWIIIPEKSTI